MLNLNTQCNRQEVPSCYRLLVILFWGQYTIGNFVIQIFRMLPIVDELYLFVIPCCFIILALLSFPWIIKHIRISDYLFYVFCLFFIFISLILYPDNAVFLYEDLWQIIGIVLPVYFIGVSYDHEASKYDLFWCSLIGVILVFIYQLLCLKWGRVLKIDNMDAAYNVLPSILYLQYWAIEKKKIWYGLIALGAIPIIFIFGTRGPIAVLLAFLLIVLSLKVIRSGSWIKKFCLFVLGGVTLLVIFSKELLRNTAIYLADLAELIGFSTRIFDKFLEEEITDGSGREYLYSTVADLIWQEPIFGRGLYGDRVVIGIYVHNIFLELWCHWGVLFGSLVILAVIFLPLYALCKSYGQEVFYFLLSLFVLIFIKLMFTGSYIQEPYLFFLLGVSMKVIRLNKRLN